MQTLWIEASELEEQAQQLQSAQALMVMPFIDEVQARRSVELAAARAGSAVQGASLLVAVHDGRRQGFVSVVNQVFRHSRSPWFGYMAQDAYAGRDWLALGLEALALRSGGLLAFNDGKWHGQLAAFGLADRSWAQSVYGGEFFFPGYRSHFADVELTLVARQQGRFVYEPNSVLVEVDWAKEQSAVHAPDRSLFRTRVRQGLGGRVTDALLLGMFA